MAQDPIDETQMPWFEDLQRIRKCDEHIKPQSFDGVLPVQTADKPAYYHIQSCLKEPVSEEEIKDLTYQVCKITCFTVETIRRRQPYKNLEQYAERDCIQRIKNLRLILIGALDYRMLGTGKRIYPPIEFKWVNGMITDKNTFDVSIGMQIGQRPLLAASVFERRGQRWICTHLDIG